mgnify:CR=1 FL=1|jgi:exodeoxyribonuclease-3
MKFKIATWNINSVRLRIGLVERFLGEHQPDMICLQETKTPDDAFPRKAFKALGYEHLAIRGQKGYHGVAIASKLPFIDVSHRMFCEKDDARHISVALKGPASPLVIHNFYVPAGGDEPDPEINDKFAHKLAFLKEMESWFGEASAHGAPMIMVGDLNIAPLEHDVWSHKQLLKVVSHTPIEVEHLTAVQRAHPWIDVVRCHIPPEQKLYTWWSYRSKDWAAADKGRRLDHIWASPSLQHACKSVQILKDARGWEQPSDHVPVMAEFELA